MYVLKLFITGKTPRSKALVNALTSMLEEEFEDQYTLMVLDIFEHPKEAFEESVIATPTLVRTLPRPVRKIIGDLSDRERVLAGLEIVPKKKD